MIQNGDSVFEVVWPGNTTPQQAGTGAVSLGGWVLQNTAVSARYVRFFNSVAAPTMGTATAKLVVPLAAGQVLAVSIERPPAFGSGLWISVTAAQPDNDNTAPTSGDVLVNVLYQ